MIKEREQQINNILGGVDVVISVISFLVAYLIRHLFFDSGISSPNEYLVVGVLIVPTWFVLLKVFNYFIKIIFFVSINEAAFS